MSDIEIPWVEKYRPVTLEDIILPADTKKIFKSIIEKGADKLPNSLLSGSPGIGKTTLGKVIGNELGMTTMYINASEEGNIETIRTKIKNFCMRMTVDGNLKLVILDEADYMSAQASAAFRGVLESYDNTRFIFTCNYPEKISGALKSRLKQIHFKPVNVKLIKKRVVEILKAENITVSQKQGPELIKLIDNLYPDIRKIIHHLQYFSTTGELEIEEDVGSDIFEEIVELIKTKKLSEIRNILRNNKCDYSLIVKKIFDCSLSNSDTILGKLSEVKRAQIIMTCEDTLFKSSFAVDKEVSFAAFCIELMKVI